MTNYISWEENSSWSQFIVQRGNKARLYSGNKPLKNCNYTKQSQIRGHGNADLNLSASAMLRKQMWIAVSCWQTAEYFKHCVTR